MKRRTCLIALPALLAACSGLSERPYAERRVFPLTPTRPGSPVAPRRGGRVLLVRSVQAAGGLDVRGLRRLRPDGTLDVSFWEEWAAPPEEAVGDAMRRWLAQSGLFGAVTSPGSRAPASWALEATLTELIAIPGTARARIAALVLDPGRVSGNIVLQEEFSAEVPLRQPDAAGQAQALVEALAGCLGQLEAALRRRV